MSVSSTESFRAIAPDLDDGEIADLLPRFERFRRSAGEQLIGQAAPADGAYLLTEGRVEVLHALPGGDEVVMAELGPGSLVGEMALLEGATRTATIRAVEAVAGLFLERRAFQAVVAQPTPAAFKILRALTGLLAARLRTVHGHIAAASTSDRFTPFRPAESAGPRLRRSESGGARAFAYRAFLPRLAFFRGFDRLEIDALVERMTPIDAQRDALLIREGEPTRGCYVVVRGALEAGLVRGGLWHPLALIGPGGLCGHAACIHRDHHGATVRVREPSVLLEIGPELFAEWSGANSPLSRKFLEALHECQLFELRQADNHLARLTSAEQIKAASAG